MSTFHEIESQTFGEFTASAGVVKTTDGKPPTFAARITNKSGVIFEVAAKDMAELMQKRDFVYREAEWMAVPEHEKIVDKDGTRMRIQMCPHCVREEAERKQKV